MKVSAWVNGECSAMCPSFYARNLWTFMFMLQYTAFVGMNIPKANTEQGSPGPAPSFALSTIVSTAGKSRTSRDSQ